jgi:uncharacterized protein (TIGR03083 family)
MAIDLGTAYTEIQDRVLATVTADSLAQAVPACPAWSVRDVVGHVAGVAKDALDGTLPSLDLVEMWRDEAVATLRDDTSDQQVVRSRGMAFDDVVDEWRATAKSLLPMLRGEEPFPGNPLFGVNSIIVTDLWVHDTDIGGALRRPRPPDDASTSVALAAYSFLVGQRVQALGLPAMSLRYGDKVRVLGDGEPAATVTADRYELARMLAGRRSRQQIAAMDWNGDPTPYLELIPAYGERQDALVD